ncbi:MAG TPA: hypothetical protein VG651_15890 [Stellaceae bacterium]|nr:hypothetical protein [Stellaceae bacterium]
MELQPAELFLICIARLWVLHHRHPDEMAADWRTGFAHMRIDSNGETGFDTLFALVAASAVRSIDIRCKTCPHLGEDEAWLLQLVGCLQRDRLAEAAAILADWLPAGTVRRAVGPAQAFAAGLAARGLVMPLRPAAAATRRHPAMARPHACPSDLLH